MQRAPVSSLERADVVLRRRELELVLQVELAERPDDCVFLEDVVLVLALGGVDCDHLSHGQEASVTESMQCERSCLCREGARAERALAGAMCGQGALAPCHIAHCAQA